MPNMVHYRGEPAEAASRRHILGVSQVQLAKLLEVSRRTVQRYEAGEYAVPRWYMLALEVLRLCTEREIQHMLERRG